MACTAHTNAVETQSVIAAAKGLSAMILPTRCVEKPWGRTTLPAPFEGAAGSKIGEIWFEPPAALPQMLVKYIFTSEKLSVQVHPSDMQAAAMVTGLRGKEECWLVVEAQPGALLGIGFTESMTSEAVRTAALDGSIEHLLAWHSVQAGDFFYIPAGTVHAIGGGVSIVEIQQNSDTTFRLYDYGRPRELHLDQAMSVAKTYPHPAHLHRHLPARGDITLVEGPHFRLDRVDGLPDEQLAAFYPGPLLVIPLCGGVEVAQDPVQTGQCALADSFADIRFDPAAEVLLTRPVSL